MTDVKHLNVSAEATETFLDHNTRSASTWKPGFIRRFPWKGLGSLIGAVIGIVGCVAILISSSGVAVGSWTVQPAVYLAIIVAVVNVLVHLALVEGVSNIWWRRLLEDGSSLADIHRRWDQGNSFLAALTAGRQTSLLAAATILVSVVPINGPLLQRASKAGNSTITAPVNVQLDAASALPTGFTGFVSGRAESASLLSPSFQPIVQGFTNNSDIPLRQDGCFGQCTGGKLNGVGFATNCSSNTFSFNLNPDGTEVAGGYQPGPATDNGTDVFLSMFTWSDGYPGVLNISVQCMTG